MKLTLLLVMAAGSLYAADEVKTNEPPKEVKKTLLEQFVIEGGYTARFHGITGHSDDGVILRAGLPFNKNVTFFAEGVAYDQPDNWQGAAIDEINLKARGSFLSTFEQRLDFYGIAGGGRNWEEECWNIGVGLGAKVKLFERLSAFTEYEIRAYFNGPEQKDARFNVGLGYQF